ncbi:CKM [Bugula neritina]|uniref:CKM n=1 Tax=Bugula neritina TaxID=10212 RepID=A0A7J7JUH1_BUGNE|nr:CKM [Bugula neritina]
MQVNDINWKYKGNVYGHVLYIFRTCDVLTDTPTWRVTLILSPRISLLRFYNKLKDLKTKSGYTIDKCIQGGIDNPNFSVGATGGDEETYTLFGDLMYGIIEGRHVGFKRTDIHKSDMDSSKLIGGDLDPNYVLSSRVRTGRSIRGYSLSPFITRAERRDVQDILLKALSNLEGPLKGKFYSLETMTPQDQQQLIDDHFLFEKPTDTFMTDTGMARDWPDARGIYHNDDKNFLVWINEEDHSRIISMQKGGNIKQVFERFCAGINQVEKLMAEQGGNEFMFNEHIGYVLTCPSNLGTGLRGGVHVKIPKLSEHPKFDEILKNCRLQKRGTGGETTTSTDGTFDISNWDRVGKTEVELVQLVIDGVELLIKMEKRLEKGESIDDILPGPDGACPRPKAPGKALDIKAIHDYKWRATPKASNFPKLHKHHNLLAKVLTEKLYNDLKGKETKSGVTLDDCIQTGVDNLGEAGAEPHAVCTLDPVIAAAGGKAGSHVSSLDGSKLGSTDLDKDLVGDCQISAGRNIRGFRLSPSIDRAERRNVEKIVSDAATSLDGSLKGKYQSLKNMSDADKNRPIMFQKISCPHLLSAGVRRDWPDARGAFTNDGSDFAVWANEVDHARVVARGQSLSAVFAKFSEGLTKFDAAVKKAGKEFMCTDCLGNLGPRLDCLGTSLQASVSVKMPKVCGHDKVKEILAGLQLRKEVGKDGGEVISNKCTLGSTEVDQVKCLVSGVQHLCKIEKALASEGPISRVRQEIKLADEQRLCLKLSVLGEVSNIVCRGNCRLVLSDCRLTR